MIIEQSNDRLSIKEEETKSMEIVFTLIFYSGVCILGYWLFEDSDLAKVSIWVKVLIITSGILIFLMLAEAMIFELPSIFTFDRVTGEFIVLHRTRFSERKKVYPLNDIKDVILMTSETLNHRDSYHTQLVIHKSKNNDYFDERVEIPGKSNYYYSTREVTEAVASFLGLAIKEETRIVREPID